MVYIRRERLFEADGYFPNRAQKYIHNSPARHKVAAMGRRTGKSTAGGKELFAECVLTKFELPKLRESGKRREFWIVGPEYCTDGETEILTTEGWKSVDQIRGDEWILAQSPEDGLARWEQMEKVSIFHGSRKMWHSQFRGHDSMTTADHRWLVKWGKWIPHIYKEGMRGGYRFKTTETLGIASEKIACALPVVNIPQSAKYADSLVELVAWYWTEGTWSADRTIEIAQNKGVNLDRIRAACTVLFGPAVSSMRNGPNKYQYPAWVALDGDNAGVRLSSPAADLIRELVAGKQKVVRPEFLCSLTKAQLELFITCSIRGDADSDWIWGKDIQIGQNVEARIDMLQMACQLAGIKTAKYIKENKYGPWYVLGLYAPSRSTIDGPSIKAKGQWIEHDGIVWCPTTPSGTWLARRNGTVYFTGNTDSEKEFRVLYNTVKKFNLPMDKPGTYYNPHASDMQLSMFDGKFLVIGKSSKYPETLVGEGLNGVILAESAKMKQSVWTKYVRPMLADFGGWSIHNSTPEGKNWFYELWHQGQSEEFSDWESWRMPSWYNNKVFPLGRQDPEILAMEQELTTETFNQEVAAMFTEFAGRVFKDFDDEIHVKDLKYNPEFQTYAACDYGFTNPFVWLLIQVDVWGNVYILDEIYQSGLTIDEAANEVISRGLAPSSLKTFYPDPAGPGETRVLEQKLRVRASGGTGGEIKNRLRLIWGLLKVRNEHLPEGHIDRQPKLFINRRCTETIREFNDYRFPDKKNQNGPESENPLKKDDHTPEAFGRFCAGYWGANSGSHGARISLANVSQ